MAYSKQTWTDGADGGTPVSAARLTHIEDGIGDLDTGLLERVQDILGAALVAGTNISSITYDDGAGTVTINAATQGGGGGGLTTEQVQDLVATMVVEGSGIDVTYDDTAGTLTFAATGGGGGGSVVDMAPRDVLAAWCPRASTDQPPGTSDGQTDFVHFSRAGHLCLLNYSIRRSSNGLDIVVADGFLPTSKVVGPMIQEANDYLQSASRIAANGVGMLAGGGNARTNGSLVWMTTQSLPGTLPGTAL